MRLMTAAMVLIVLGGVAGCGSGINKASGTNTGSAFSEAMTTLGADKRCNGIPTAPGCIRPYRAACEATIGSVPGEPHQRELMCGQVTEAEAKLAEAPSETTPATTSEPVVSACSQLERYERNPDYSEEVCRSRLKIYEGGRHTQETYQEELRACGAARGSQAEREACSGKRTLEAAKEE